MSFKFLFCVPALFSFLQCIKTDEEPKNQDCEPLQIVQDNILRVYRIDVCPSLSTQSQAVQSPITHGETTRTPQDK